MRGRFARNSQIAGRAHQARTEQLLPKPIHRHSSRQRMLRTQQPLGKAQPIAGQIGRHRRQRRGRARAKPGRAVCRNLHETEMKAIGGSVRSCITWATVPRPLISFSSRSRLASLPVSSCVGLSSVAEPPVENFGGFRLAALGGRFGHQVSDASRLGQLRDFGVGQRAAINPQILNRRSVQTRGVVPLRNFQRHLGPNRILQPVDRGRHRLRHTVEVDFHTGRFARSVVAHQQVIPLANLDRGVGHDLQRVGYPNCG